MDSPPYNVFLLMAGIFFLVIGLACRLQQIEEDALRQSRCRHCQAELASQPAFCPDCGRRSQF